MKHTLCTRSRPGLQGREGQGRWWEDGETVRSTYKTKGRCWHFCFRLFSSFRLRSKAISPFGFSSKTPKLAAAVLLEDWVGSDKPEQQREANDVLIRRGDEWSPVEGKGENATRSSCHLWPEASHWLPLTPSTVPLPWQRSPCWQQDTSSKQNGKF